MPIPKTLSADPYAILDPVYRWQPDSSSQLPLGQLMPPLVEQVRQATKNGAKPSPDVSSATRSLLSWWFDRDEGDNSAIRYYFSQREAVESVIYLYEAVPVPVKDKFDLMRFSTGAITPGQFDEDWLRFVVKMAAGAARYRAKCPLPSARRWSRRARLGDWEVDTIIGRGHKSALVSLTERKSRLTLLGKVRRKTADEVGREVVRLLRAAGRCTPSLPTTAWSSPATAPSPMH